jgi:hypothetical protein
MEDQMFVVFEGTKETGPGYGMRFLMEFESEQKFQEWYSTETQALAKVIEKDLTREDAIALCESISPEFWIERKQESNFVDWESFKKRISALKIF